VKVYIVTLGEQSEGESPKSVHSTRDGAIVHALERNRACFGEWTQTDADEWRCGCDILSVKEWEVEP